MKYIYHTFVRFDYYDSNDLKLLCLIINVFHVLMMKVYGNDDEVQLEERKVSWSDPDRSGQSNEDLDEWNKIKLWLKNEVGLPQYIEPFLDNDLNSYKAIKEINKDELRDIGIKRVAHRRKIMKHVEKIKKGQYEL